MREILRRNEGTSLRELQRSNFKNILDAVGDAETILLGEATHGTEEFYRTRADLTAALLQQADFDAVLCEGDFAPFSDLNRYVGGAPAANRRVEGDPISSMQDAFARFDRFPVWMWRNDAFVKFVAWLADFNQQRERHVQLLGIDVYGIYQSTSEVVSYLEASGEADMAQSVRASYSTIESFRPEAADYGKAVFYHAVPSQAQNVTQVLKQLREQERRLPQHLGDEQELWNALENARVVAESELFHRQLMVSRERKDDGMLWNIREAAMFHALQNARSHIASQIGRPARVIIWAHNSHVGDARASDHAKKRGGPPHFNLGQLCRQVMGKKNVYIVGFTCNQGTVRAAREWGEEDRVMKLLPAFEGSHEYLLGELSAATHRNIAGYCLRSNRVSDLVDEAARELFSTPRIQRFVGVSYVPDKELQSHYSTSNLSEGFDYVMHVDQSHAVKSAGLKSGKAGMHAEKATKNQQQMYLLDAFGKDETR